MKEATREEGEEDDAPAGGGREGRQGRGGRDLVAPLPEHASLPSNAFKILLEVNSSSFLGPLPRHLQLSRLASHIICDPIHFIRATRSSYIFRLAPRMSAAARHGEGPRPGHHRRGAAQVLGDAASG
jgi:hypothetical protein